MTRAPHFELFGIPVRIGGGAILLTMAAVYFLQATGAGIAAAFIVSVLIHELGHAFAFRRFGATSSISIHGLGGMTVSYDAHRLSHGQHVIVSAAGPLIQLLLLGLPALAISLLMPVTGIAATVLRIMVFINIGWAVVNLLPLYPLDGGQILFHSLSHRGKTNAWGITRTVAIVLGVPLALLAFQYGFQLGALLIGFTIYQGISSPPYSAAMGSSNPIRDAAARARSDHNPALTHGAKGTDIVNEAHRHLAAESPRRFEMLVTALDEGGRNEDVAGLRAWAGLLDGDTSTAHPGSTIFGLTKAVALPATPPGPAETITLQRALVAPNAADEALVAIAVLHQRGRLSEVLSGAATGELTGLADASAVAGMLNEQMAIRRLVQLTEAD